MKPSVGLTGSGPEPEVASRRCVARTVYRVLDGWTAPTLPRCCISLHGTSVFFTSGRSACVPCRAKDAMGTSWRCNTLLTGAGPQGVASTALQRCSAKSPSFGGSVVSSAQERHDALTGRPLLTALWMFRAGTLRPTRTDGAACLDNRVWDRFRLHAATSPSDPSDPNPIHAPRHPTRASPGRSCPQLSGHYEDLALNGRSRDIRVRRMAWPTTLFALGLSRSTGVHGTRRDRNCRHRA